MHIAPYDNQNKPIVDVNDPTVPLNYFNIVKLKKGDAFEYQVPGFETCIVPATGSVDVEVEGFKANDIGGRVGDVWGGGTGGGFVPGAAQATFVCSSCDPGVLERAKVGVGKSGGLRGAPVHKKKKNTTIGAAL